MDDIQAENLRRVVEACEEAIAHWVEPEVGTETSPLDYAAAQNNLGNACRDLAAALDADENRAETLRRAIDAYLAALMHWTPTTAPFAHAMTRNNLGNVYRELSELEDRESNLRRAIDAYLAALVYGTPENAPSAYTMIQNNLGNAYSELAQLEDRAEDREGNLRRAIDAYRVTLEYHTAQTSPLTYAQTQHNLGIAYEELGDLGSAVVCWREAELYYREKGVHHLAALMAEWIADAADEEP
jgi:tetratricopeptide (TPR) repeat protein